MRPPTPTRTAVRWRSLTAGVSSSFRVARGAVLCPAVGSAAIEKGVLPTDGHRQQPSRAGCQPRSTRLSSFTPKFRTRSLLAYTVFKSKLVSG
jgi:hypothetical protein